MHVQMEMEVEKEGDDGHNRPYGYGGVYYSQTADRESGTQYGRGGGGGNASQQSLFPATMPMGRGDMEVEVEMERREQMERSGGGSSNTDRDTEKMRKTTKAAPTEEPRPLLSRVGETSYDADDTDLGFTQA